MGKPPRITESVSLSDDTKITLTCLHDGICRFIISSTAVDVTGIKPVVSISYSVEIRPEKLRTLAELLDRVADAAGRPAPKIEEAVDLSESLKNILLAPYKKSAVS